jgi:hypothetical protein
MKLLSTLAIALISVSFFAGCSEDSTPNNYTVQNVYPLKEYKFWTYRYGELDDNGNYIDDFITHITVEDTTTYKGMPAFVVDEDGTLGQDRIMYYSNDEVRYSDRPEDLIAKYPMKVNETVTLKDTTYANGKRIRSIFKLLAENEQVTVYVGTFSALHYERINTTQTGTTIDTTSATHTYFAFNVGLIKREDYVKNVLVGVYKLYNYRVK